ncbi:MAG: hypothetical protein H6939_05195 [Burkholderiales bacterium]|nr:hypothetical protein [Burkholderiales bacterium]
MNKSKLARGLDISRTMLYKLEARGMPTDSLEAAIEWRRQNLDVTQTKQWRIDGNKGVNRELAKVNNPDDLEALHDVDVDYELKQLGNNLKHKNLSRVLTHVMPKLWFEQMGWLGSVLKDRGVKITAEQLIEVQSRLFMIYMEAVTDYLGAEDDELLFYAGPVLKAMPGDEIYPSLMARLNKILGNE